jgi:hypothetical protein
MVFGLMLTLNIHPNGDGLWYWYALALRHHQRLYSDLHFNQQPLFVLLTAGFQQLLGTSWLASKVLALMQLVLYCAGLFLVARRIAWQDWQCALLVAAVFGMTISDSFYRFDDYHITTQCFQVFSLLLLFRLRDHDRKKPCQETVVCALLGFLSGLATANRINDGVGLCVSSVIILFFFIPARRFRSLVVYASATAFSFLGTIALTLDSFAAWRFHSITEAARIKGGSGNLVVAILSFPYRVAAAVLHPKGLLLIFALAVVFYLFKQFPGALRAGARLRGRWDWILSGVMLLLTVLFVSQAVKGLANQKLGQLGVLLIVPFGVWIHLRPILAYFRLASDDWDRAQMLFAVPFWSLVAGAMTAGSTLPGYEPSVAVALLLLPLLFEPAITWIWVRRGTLVVAWLIVVASLVSKLVVPYEWHHFRSEPLFVDRVWYHHPQFGPMYLERPQLTEFLPVCQAIQRGSGSHDLLSIPFPYPNYFCDMPPWHGYVQTWYDISGPETINRLTSELSAAPPRWIVYQRAGDSMRLNEMAYSGGRASPQRELDALIMARIVNRSWTIVQRSCYDGSDWIFIRTTPPAAGEHRGNTADAADRSPVLPTDPRSPTPTCPAKGYSRLP